MNASSCLFALIASLCLSGNALLSPWHRQSPLPRSAPLHFVEHPIDSALSGGYQVIVTDLNRDGKPDIIALASGLHELAWYENPRWEKHVITTGINAPINAAAFDVDGDGIPEIALAHAFSTEYASSAGIVSVLTHGVDPTMPWASREIDRLPTSHRLRFADIDGSGRKALVNFPLIGEHAKAPDYRDSVPLVLYRPGAWQRELISNADQGVVHGIFPTVWSDGKRESLLSASFLGVFALQFDKGQWSRTRITAGNPSAWPKSGASEIVVAHLGRERILVTIEPWHGNQVVVYRMVGTDWQRHVIDESIADGHAIVVSDLDDDGNDEIVVGERGGKRGVYLYRVTNAGDNQWTREFLDAGNKGAAGCAVGDLNADKRIDVVCISTAAARLTWYENTP